jgi:hypothetical protein
MLSKALYNSECITGFLGQENPHNQLFKGSCKPSIYNGGARNYASASLCFVRQSLTSDIALLAQEFRVGL